MTNHETFPPIFVVSLATNKLRRQHITRELDKHQLTYKIIDAVDGATLDDKTINGVYSEKLAINNFKRALSKGEIGCALSHLSIYKKMLNDDIERAIILEDDAIIGDNFVNVIKNINKIEPKSWELILLGYNEGEKGCYSTCSVKASKPNKSLNFSIIKPLSLALQAHAYLINQQGAKHLIKLTQPLYQPIDHYTGDAKLVDVYCVNSRCARVNFNLQSVITPERKPMQEQIRASITVRLLQRILPPFLYTAVRAFYRLFKDPVRVFYRSLKYSVLIILYHTKFYK